MYSIGYFLSSSFLFRPYSILFLSDLEFLLQKAAAISRFFADVAFFSRPTVVLNFSPCQTPCSVFCLPLNILIANEGR